MSKVSGVVVTYRRPGSLEKCLESMCGQSYPLSRIFVIDNGPDDAARHVAEKYRPLTDYRHFPENIGSEGGYCEGIRLGEAAGDYVWLLDDDSVSDKDALAELVKCMTLLEKGGKVGAVRSARAWDKRTDQPVREITDLFAWRGVLISSAAVRDIGLPEKGLFLYGGDIEYGMRMAEAGYRMYLSFASRIESLELSGKVRRTFWILKAESYSQPYRVYYSYRNELRIMIEHKRIARAAKVMLSGIKNIIFHLVDGETGRAAAVWDGMADALRNRLGKRAQYLP